jgi:hypothetical protein
MQGEPWIYFAAGTMDPWNSTTNGYPWYDAATWDGNGVGRGDWTARTDTLLFTAKYLEIGLPDYVAANSVSTLHGSYVSGGTSDIAGADDYSYQINAATYQSSKATAAELQFTVPSAIATVALNVCLRASVYICGGYVEIWNWNTSQYESVSYFTLATVKEEALISLPTGSNYMNGSRVMKLKVLAVYEYLVSPAPAFSTELDLAQLVVTY